MHRLCRPAVYAACFLVACSNLKTASEVVEENDGGTSSDTGTDAEAGDDDDDDPSPPLDGGRTCPVASDEPEALVYATTKDTVFDSRTRLMWERAFRESELDTYEDAAQLCAALRTAGEDDWRVPTRSELLSIADYAEDIPKISRTTFTEAKPDIHWTSTKHDKGTRDYWLIDFFTGESIHFASLSNGVDGGPPVVLPTVRCVRTVDPPCTAKPRFVRKEKVVLDRITGAEWEIGSGSPRDGVEASQYCKALTGMTSRPWRIPTVKESDTLITGTAASGYIDPAFSGSAWKEYWTSTKGVGELDSSYSLDVSLGTIREKFSDPPMAVRCVR